MLGCLLFLFGLRDPQGVHGYSFHYIPESPFLCNPWIQAVISAPQCATALMQLVIEKSRKNTDDALRWIAEFRQKYVLKKARCQIQVYCLPASGFVSAKCPRGSPMVAAVSQQADGFLVDTTGRRQSFVNRGRIGS